MISQLTSAQKINGCHRSKVAQTRREKTRAKLLKSALHVFARHGVDASIIDLIIKEAGLSRGTFYNYFTSNEELFIAVAEEVSNQIIRFVDPLVMAQNDAAARVACGVSMVLELAKAYPIFAEFVVRGGIAALGTGSLTRESVPRDINAGIASGQFSITDKRLAFDLIVGPVIAAFHTLLSEDISENYPRALAQAVLQSLGVDKAQAIQYASIEFGEISISEDSIFNQPQLRIPPN